MYGQNLQIYLRHFNKELYHFYWFKNSQIRVRLPRFKRSSVIFSDFPKICFRHEKFSATLCLLLICSSSQASIASCEKCFSLLNRIKTLSRCGMNSYHMDQVMILESVLSTVYQKQQIEESNNAWIIYHDSTIILNQVVPDARGVCDSHRN